MAICRRLRVIASVPIAVIVILAMTQVTGLAFKPAGNYLNTSMLASLFYGPDSSGTSIFFFANRQITVGPGATTDNTSISLNVAAGFGSVNVNCFINVSSNAFDVVPDVSAASVHTTIAQSDPGCGGSLPSDIQVDITWAGAGPIQSTHSINRFSCSGYMDESQGDDSNNAGIATFVMTGLDSIQTPDPQTFHFGSSREHIQGAVPPDSCSGGVGRGAGRQTPAAGNYHTTHDEAFTNFSASDGSSSLSMGVFGNTSDANPLVGPSTSTAETDLFLNLNTATGAAASGCFVINGGDFVVDAPSASLHTTLTGNTPACQGSVNFISTDPFQIDVTWTAASPVATTRRNQQYACQNYRFQTGVVQVVDTIADAQVSMPGLSGALPGSTDFGSIDNRTHADGTPAPGCFFRG